MSTVDLHEAVLGQGVRRPNYFNGRVLTAEDLRADQDAARAYAKALARAAGDGIASGMRVRPGGLSGAPSVTVSAGLAVNPAGDPLELSAEVAVRLVAEPRPETSPTADSGFSACLPPDARASGAGLYVLTIAPASGTQGRAPRVAPGGAAAGACGPRWTVDGLRFRLLPVDPTALAIAAGIRTDALDPADAGPQAQSRIRSAVAHALLGSGGVADRGRDPLRRGDPDGLAVLRREGLLAPDDVPLALLRWGGGVTVDFVDEWAARRPRQPGDDPQRALEILLGPQRPVSGAASILQFAAHLDDLLAQQRRVVIPGVGGLRPPVRGPMPPRLAPSLASMPRFGAPISARDHFVRLPPAGILPVQERRGDRGIVPDVFFAGMAMAPVVHITGADVEPLLRSATAYPPIDPHSGEAVWQYLVAENRMARDQGEDVQPVLIFATGHLPDIGDAQYDLGRHDYANVTRRR